MQPASPMPGPPPPGEGSSQYGRTFVGRQAELQQLRAAFDAAISGRGGLAALAGEPGIGKTALCERLTDYVGFSQRMVFTIANDGPAHRGQRPDVAKRPELGA